MQAERPLTPQTLQDIPPKWAHFCLYVEQFITDDLAVDLTGKTILVGLSGGADSTALLHLLHYLAPKNGSTVLAAHLDHQLRVDAQDDARMVRAQCDSLGISLIESSMDVEALAKDKGVGLEEAGRTARYEFYERVMEDHEADLLALGHHLDDLCEDVLMRLIRGTGWPGLSGMPGHDSERKLIRPLLTTPKHKLKEFLLALGVSWCEDPTNAHTEVMRNRVRNTIMPMLLEENPSFPSAIARLWKVGRIDEDFWRIQTEDIGDTLPDSRLKSSHQAQRLRLYKSALDRLGAGQVLAESLFKLDKGWQDGNVGGIYQFPGDKIATITSRGVVFSDKD